MLKSRSMTPNVVPIGNLGYWEHFGLFWIFLENLIPPQKLNPLDLKIQAFENDTGAFLRGKNKCPGAPKCPNDVL